MGTFVQLLGKLWKLIDFVRENSAKASVLAGSVIAYLADAKTKLQTWWGQVDGLSGQIQGWMDQSKAFNIDLGLGYRMANWIFPVDEFFSLITQLVAIAAVILAIRLGIWLLNLGVRIVTIFA